MADFVFVYVANPDHGLQRKSQTRLAPILKSNHMQAQEERTIQQTNERKQKAAKTRIRSSVFELLPNST